MARGSRRNADEALLLSLACGATPEQAAQKAGVSPRTAYRRQADPAFARRVQAARGDMAQRAGGALTAAAMESIKTLLELQRPPSPPSVRLGAARAVLEMGLKVREAAELEGRLAALEARLAEGDAGGRRWAGGHPMRLQRRIERLERLAPPPPDRAGRLRRLKAVLHRWERLFEAAVVLLTPAEQERAHEAVRRLVAEAEAEMDGRILEEIDGSPPLRDWLRDLCEGCSRLPGLAPEVMRDLLRAWLSPQADGGVVCNGCGLEYPRHKAPPGGWKLLPGKRPQEGPPPWYDLPEFFHACPHCGGSRFDIDWPHLAGERHHAWKGLDGYAGG